MAPVNSVCRQWSIRLAVAGQWTAASGHFRWPPVGNFKLPLTAVPQNEHDGLVPSRRYNRCQ